MRHTYHPRAHFSKFERLVLVLATDCLTCDLCLKPETGHCRQELAGLGGDVNFVKVETDNKVYWPLGRYMVRSYLVSSQC